MRGLSARVRSLTRLKAGGVAGWKQRSLDLSQTLPVTLPAGLAAFGAVAVACLLLNRFSTWLVLPLGLSAAYVAARLAHRQTLHHQRPGSRKEQTICDVVVVAGVLLWMLGNVPFTAQHIFTDRDPATYAVAGAWLTNHDELRIPVPAGFSDVAGTTVSSLGFSRSTQNDNEVYAQGSHILPAFLGMAGRLFGAEAMLRFNLVFGGAALLAVYGLARLLMKPRWALGAVLTLSLSLPLIYFSRDTYTEPMALAFIFSSLAFLWYAEHSKGYAPWLLAGLALGAAILVRIDTYLPVAAIYAFLLVQLAVTKPGSRLSVFRRQLLFAIPVALLGLLAWLDLTQLSSGYYRDLRPQFMAEMGLLAAVTAGGAGLITISWKTGLLGQADKLSRRWRYPAGVTLLVAFFVFLASRSLWQTNYAMKDGTAVRSYAEHSLIWMSWYLGPVLAVLAIVAIILIGAQILRGRLLRTLPAMCMIAACLYYLINPNISSDQVWAARRFLPVILPGFAILGFLLLSRLHERQPFVLRGLPVEPRQTATALAMLALIGPLFVSFPFLATRTYAPQLSQVDFICANLPRDAVVVWTGSAKDTSMQPTHAFCGVPSLGIANDAKLEEVLPELVAAGEANGKRVVIGVKSGEAGRLPAHLQQHLTSEHTIAYADLEQTYKKFPRNRVVHTQTLVLGELTPDNAIAKSGTAGIDGTDQTIQ